MTRPLLPALEALTEHRIREAAERGEFDDLPGQGRPLELDDDRLVPEELRLAHRILKNAGCLPPEAQQLAQIGQSIAMLGRAELSAGDREATARRVRALLIQMDIAGRPASAARAWLDYQDALGKRLAR